ncbi:ImmA/IrrE family metallo-endopeptidase [Gordonia sp. CNJ-863]|uniref:ImmA/IrrE family metallo-endopeptidase n=1 Tax=Gordonia sp. CNJ-863 TaxID=1904963 RepID=UPI001301050D|nr:ImmA/IrrE family metallo-endopeptidase [Gordonia sp. CNJ-863]
MVKFAMPGLGSWKWRRESRPGLVEQVLSEIPVVPPWTVDEFCSWIENRYDRKVVLSPWQTEAPNAGEPGSCGLLWVTQDAFIINYDDTRSERHQRQQIFHEIGHILCDHQGGQWNPTAMAAVADGLDLNMVERVLHRSVFDSEEENAAELVGTRLAVLSRGQRGDGRFDRIASAFFEPLKQ